MPFGPKSTGEKRFWATHNPETVDNRDDKSDVPFKANYIKRVNRSATRQGNDAGDDEKVYDQGAASGEFDQAPPGLNKISLPQVVTQAEWARERRLRENLSEVERVAIAFSGFAKTRLESIARGSDNSVWKFSSIPGMQSTFNDPNILVSSLRGQIGKPLGDVAVVDELGRHGNPMAESPGDRWFQTYVRIRIR
jgi:hypothetical protein